MTHTRVIRILIVLGLLGTAAYFIVQTSASDKEYIEKIEAGRKQKDWNFRSSNSPLPEAQRAGFSGLSYFAPDPAYRFRCAMQKLSPPEPVALQTTGSDTQTYTRYASVNFTLNGKEHSLFMYQRPAGSADQSFFIPFTDLTNGHTTYGGGRYLDVQPVAPLEIELDFNQAYNPFCAYNHDYSCPVPPKENHLSAEIKAGEKTFTAP